MPARSEYPTGLWLRLRAHSKVLLGTLRAIALFAVLLLVGHWALYAPTHGSVNAHEQHTLRAAIKYLVCAYLTFMLLETAWRLGLKSSLAIIKSITPLVVLQNVGILALVGAAGVGLYFAFPVLQWSWLYLLAGSSGGARAMNVALLPVTVEYFGLVFLVLFGLTVPYFARAEEMRFRLGTKDWRDGALRSIGFGLSHCWMGIPIAWGMALTIGGLWFTYQYFKGGVGRSTMHHTAYNLIVVVCLFVGVAYSTFAG